MSFICLGSGSEGAAPMKTSSFIDVMLVQDTLSLYCLRQGCFVFVWFSVCVIAGQCKNYLADLHETRWRVAASAKE